MKTREQQAMIVSPEAGFRNANEAKERSGNKSGFVVEEGGEPAAPMADYGQCAGVHASCGNRNVGLRLEGSDAARSDCDTVFRI